MIVAHAGGLPVEETMAQLVPVGIALLVTFQLVAARTRRWTARLHGVRTHFRQRRSALFARVNFLETQPDRRGVVARGVHQVVLRGIRGEAGYVGYVVLDNGGTGKGGPGWPESPASGEGPPK